MAISPRIAVIEDEEALSILLRYNLEAEGWQVTTLLRGDSTIKYVGTDNYVPLRLVDFEDVANNSFVVSEEVVFGTPGNNCGFFSIDPAISAALASGRVGAQPASGTQSSAKAAMAGVCICMVFGLPSPIPEPPCRTPLGGAAMDEVRRWSNSPLFRIGCAG